MNDQPAAARSSRHDHARGDRDHGRDRDRDLDRRDHDRDRSSRKRDRKDRKADKSSSSSKSSKKAKRDREKKDKKDKHKSSSKRLKFKASSSSSSSRRRRHHDSDSTSSSSDGSDDDALWVEKPVVTASSASAAGPAPPPPPPAAEVASLQRESWMTGGGDDANDNTGFARLVGGPPRRAPQEPQRHVQTSDFDLKISAREINPYWKDGGKGLPPTAADAAAARPDSDVESTTSSRASSVTHFMMKKVERVLEIAQDEDRPVEEVGIERFGSKDAFDEAYEAFQATRKPAASARSKLAHVQSASDASVTATASSSSPAPSLLPAAGPADATGTTKHVVLPTIDLRGRALATMLPSTSSNPDDMSLEELVRREKMGLGEDMDRALTKRIARDTAFRDDLEYMDENADMLSSTATAARKRPENETKRKVAIDDYVRQQQALAKCHFCFKDGKLPPVSIISIGVRAYLALVPYESVATCQIIPVDHMVTTLDGDDAFWDEVRNFQKCLMRMYHAQGKAVLFTETVLDTKWQRHTVIDVIPVPAAFHGDAPGYFREALQSAEVEADEWTQHAAILDTRAKPGGFRRSMVPNLPYFHVWFDLDGGYGHVIEERARGMHDQFAREVVANALDLDPMLGRKQRPLPRQVNHDRVRAFVKQWSEYDWTKMLEGGEYADANE
ncbi:hypothetical protein AMAG_08451 [Allomyces macrogynus ATCC 38327]|uniref:Cwf19-like C-terminal domain-containing protein n=1 Tax=Allomyces macrogynus (strain ATCC 38327) TaxID=578462 RepID=A0A0L0SLB8_ALLM3|nr:hypothetical protein AMAG_08451 [Allomyces macrogynus ATCC 38327]|eukprot:KNE63312.1 hypothetical protein AMAG_08451 [Allomyces macrogynus ATCC 38327]